MEIKENSGSSEMTRMEKEIWVKNIVLDILKKQDSQYFWNLCDFILEAPEEEWWLRIELARTFPDSPCLEYILGLFTRK